MRKSGNILILAGLLFLTAAGLLIVYNFGEDFIAGKSSRDALVRITEEMKSRDKTNSKRVIDPYNSEMAVVEIDGVKYVGVLSIPKLDLELPVISELTYPNLRKAPCRYTGSANTNDLTIAAHNYKRHFGRIGNLKAGDRLTFTDVDGGTNHYSVAAVEVLNAGAYEDMTGGEYALTLFTCTYGGENRVTVRCDKVGY